MSARSSCLLLCVLSLCSCDLERERRQDATDSESLRDSVRAGDFPPGKQIASEKVFAEDVLQGWGYLTTEVAATYHAIRSSKDYGSGREAFYARFHLAKARFADHADAQNAKNRIEALLLGDAGFKNYTQIIQQDEMLYSVSATSNYTFLEHQPNLLALARAHLATQAEEDGGHKP